MTFCRYACGNAAHRGSAPALPCNCKADELPAWQAVTDRLILRAPKAEDFEAYAEIVCSDRGRFMGGPLQP